MTEQFERLVTYCFLYLSNYSYIGRILTELTINSVTCRYLHPRTAHILLLIINEADLPSTFFVISETKLQISDGG